MDNRTQLSVDEETKRLTQQMAERQNVALSDSCRQLAEQVKEAFNKLENGKSEFVSHDDARLDMEARKTKVRNRTTNGR
ncbi:damage-inducible protein J [Marisediminitalea sp.]|uniref:damage-inducible protein J n=1 Tax=Marisediminitalea sp. TaxID=2662268 RepID=UPI000C3C7296|nr:damage-inducible protein J [Alteromonadaceae bacterium]MAX41701.1 damage-inducible protein J [Alteromonadaceae bacterium]HBY40888.1 damage-inducible protein J [Alteromonas sp.]|tara:strand:+ start:1195 stop:1431 length:237 start_codon:yes stop_codon:yes gene_type:complete